MPKSQDIVEVSEGKITLDVEVELLGQRMDGSYAVSLGQAYGSFQLDLGASAVRKSGLDIRQTWRVTIEKLVD